MQQSQLIIILLTAVHAVCASASSQPSLERTFTQVDALLESSQISYAWGGSKVGDPGQCDLCINCLERSQVKPKQQLKACPECKRCSLDCSHFVHKVLNFGGYHFGYLTTKTMLNLAARDLARRYRLIDIGKDARKATRGDLAVYRNHVVLIEKMTAPGKATIVHATGGRDIKAPGLGIQRERQVVLSQFRGPLLRILRHRDIVLRGRQVKQR